MGDGNRIIGKHSFPDDFEITNRELLCSIAIAAVMLLVGFIISGSISEHQIDINEKYNKAVKIESPGMFEYGMRTNIGNAFVYGDLEAVDPVRYPEIEGDYMYLKKVKEKYTMHTRTVTTRVNGHTRTKTEVYWTWDYVDHEELESKKVIFLGHTFDIGKIDIPSSSEIDTIKESSKIRYVYYGVPAKHTGTIFTELKDGTITDSTYFYKDYDIAQTTDLLRAETGFELVCFWIFWIALIGVALYGFYYLDNRWLE